MKKNKLLKIIKNSIPEWNCFGFFGYGQGRAVAEFGQDEVGESQVCYSACGRSDDCRRKHLENMDNRFPMTADVVKRAIVEAKRAGIPVVPLVISAMDVSVARGDSEAIQIREGLKKFGADTITDHYIYGQFENLNNGINKQNSDKKIPFVLIGSNLL